MSAQIVQFPGAADIDLDLAACREVKEQRTAKAIKGWQTRRRNGWQGRAKSLSKAQTQARGAELGDFVARAVKLLARMPRHDAECWLAYMESQVEGDGGAA